jgi:hypothetical protein
VQDRPINFNVLDKENVINVGLDSISQVTFKELQPLKFRCSIIGKYPQLYGKTPYTPLSSPTTYQHEGRFSSYTLISAAYLNRLYAEADGRIQLAFVKAAIEELCRNVK